MADMLKMVLPFIFGTLGVGSLIVTYIKNFKRKLNATEEGVQALLRSQIIALYNKYIDIGYMPIYERENLEKLYKQYKVLKGNGVIEDLKKELDDLPTKQKTADRIKQADHFQHR